MTNPTQRTAERHFYTGMSVAVLCVVLLGFGQSFYLRPFFPDSPAPSYPMVLFHGVLFSSWVGLFVAQVGFIRKDNFLLHRRAGTFAAYLAPVLVIQGALLAQSAVKVGRVDPRFGSALPLVLPVGDLLLFSMFVALGFLWRKKPQHHKRAMLLATINFINAAIGRIPGATQSEVIPALVFASFVVAMAVWDRRSDGKVHRITLVGGVLSVLSMPLRFMLSETAAWKSFEQWVVSL